MTASATHSNLARPAPAADSVTGSSAARATGNILVVAWACYVVGAIVFAVSGIDIDGATQAGTIPAELDAFAAGAPTASVTYMLWIVGATLFALAGGVMFRLSDDVHASIAGTAAILGAGLAILSYVAFLGLLHLATTAPGDGTAAAAMGWLGTTVDWIATILILGVMPVAFAASGHGRWASSWLRPASLAPAAAALLTVVSLATRTGITTWGFALVPVGMVFTLVMALQLRARG